MQAATHIPAEALWLDPPPDLASFGRRVLAEGDSWFTLGTANLARSSNLLFHLGSAQSMAIVSCAKPGDTLQHMAHTGADPLYERLLCTPGQARYWDALLFSGGGNDLVDAVQHAAVHADGTPATLAERLLLTPAEAAQVHPGLTTALRYVSEPGWALLAEHLLSSLAAVVQRRDRGPSAGRPLVLHTYSVPVARPSGNLNTPLGWLYKAYVQYGIPVADHAALTEELFGRLRRLWLKKATRLHNVHVFDSAAIPLLPANSEDHGASGDWENEIHPTTAGYEKIGQAMSAWLDSLLAQA
jgi:hypothetical protein